MISVIYGDRFLRSAQKLTKKQQTKLANLLTILQQNPFNRSLHAKHLSGPLTGLFSFRITRDWRVIFQFFSSDEIKLIDIGHRREIYR